jgi:uncharacterized protein (TIGR02246 family)
MRRFSRHLTVVVCLLVASAASAQDIAQELVRLERGAMDRWAKGDPGGFIDLMAQDVTVVDAFTDGRVDGLDAVREHYKAFAGRVSIPRYDIVKPTVQRAGDMAVLTYNFIAYGADNEVISRWNFSEVYRRAGARWEIVHSHASYRLGRPATP